MRTKLLHPKVASFSLAPNFSWVPATPVRPATAVLAFLLLLPVLDGRADELAEKGRAIFNSNHHAVVTVQLVLKSKVSFGGRGGEANESRQDVTGSVLDPSGLTVLALSATDPTQLYQNLMAGMADLGDDENRLKMESELSDVKILLNDGTEVPAEVILRDKDLDLAFIRPKAKPAAPMAALDLANAGKAQILDQVITLNRLGSAAGRSYSAAVERISAVVQKPRLYYIPDSTMTTTTLGSPAFTLDGKALGIFAMRSTKAKSGGALMGLFGGQADALASVIVPVADVLKAAKQVPARLDEKETK